MISLRTRIYPRDHCGTRPKWETIVRITIPQVSLKRILVPGARDHHGMGLWFTCFRDSRFKKVFFLMLCQIRKRQPSERISARNRLGTNAIQYGSKILEPYLVPYLYSQEDPLESYFLMGDGAGYHTAGICIKHCATYNIENLPWTANSPELNPFEMRGTH